MESEQYKDIYNYELKHWWYKTRRIIILNLVNKYFKKNSPEKILDIGCGPGALLSELDNKYECYGIDNSPLATDFCKKRGLKNVQLGSILDITHKNESFDLILALDILEHVEDDSRALEELKRVLKPGGIIIVFVPTFMCLWGINDETGQHYRRYKLKDLHKKVKNHNLEIIRSSYFNTFLFIPIFLVRNLTKLLKTSSNPEITMSPGIFNKLFFAIFLLESKLLKFIDFPFGVSGMLVIQKRTKT